MRSNLIVLGILVEVPEGYIQPKEVWSSMSGAHRSIHIIVYIYMGTYTSIHISKIWKNQKTENLAKKAKLRKRQIWRKGTIWEKGKILKKRKIEKKGKNPDSWGYWTEEERNCVISKLDYYSNKNRKIYKNLIVPKIQKVVCLVLKWVILRMEKFQLFCLVAA